MNTALPSQKPAVAPQVRATPSDSELFVASSSGSMRYSIVETLRRLTRQIAGYANDHRETQRSLFTISDLLMDLYTVKFSSLKVGVKKMNNRLNHSSSF